MALAANSVLLYAVWRGINIGDTATNSPQVQQLVGTHMLIGLGALVFAALVHAVTLTYFMGTGRFLEETGHAYSLPREFHRRSQRLKYRILPGMLLCLLLLISTGALGAVADRATPASMTETFGISDARVHLGGSIVMLATNLIVTLLEYRAVTGNSRVIDEVLCEVRRIRLERGLPVE